MPGDYPSGVAVAPSGVWVTSWSDVAVSRIDPATNTVIQTVKVGTVTVTDPVVDSTGSSRTT